MSNSSDSQTDSIRKRVFKLLDKNPLLTAKPICKQLELDYSYYHQYVAKLRRDWKLDPERQRGSKYSVHAWRGYTYLPRDVSDLIREKAVSVGWIRTKARNKWLLYKEKLGRLQWFQTGRVNLYVRKPANLGRCYQLVVNGFIFTGLITDVVLSAMLKNIRFKGAHYVFPVGQRLPRLTIDLFAKSSGIVVKVGDRTHPDSLEVIAHYPDWGERNEKLFKEFMEVVKRLMPKPDQDLRVDRPQFYG